MRPRAFALIAAVFTLVSFWGVASFPSILENLYNRAPWSQWRPATCLPDACFCEALRPGAVIQPANTWSSLAFVGAALWILWRNVVSKRGPFGSHMAFPIILSAAGAALGFGSAFYHASLTFVGLLADVQGMQFVALFAFVFNWRHRLGGPLRVAFIYVALDLASLAIQAGAPITRRVLFAVTIFAAAWSEWSQPARDRKWFIASLATLGVAFVIWTVDITRVVCSPESRLQGHAVWHVLGALAVAFAGEHFRSGLVTKL